MNIKAVKLEKRRKRKSSILRDDYRPGERMEKPPIIAIEPGAPVQVKYDGRNICLRITKAAGYEFVGRILALDNASEKFEDLAIDDYLKFYEENIFSVNPFSES